MDDAARQKTTKAIATLTNTLVQSWCTSVPNAANGAAATRMFFTHCRGRIALTTPTIRLAGGPATSLSTSPTSLLISTLHLSSADSPASPRAGSRPASSPGVPIARPATVDPGGYPFHGRCHHGANRHTGRHVARIVHTEQHPGERHRRHQHDRQR